MPPVCAATSESATGVARELRGPCMNAIATFRQQAQVGLPPAGWIGRMVKVQWDSLFVRLLDPKTDQLLREHVRQ